MKRTTLFTFCLLLVTSFLWAQTYTTPNTGVTWTLDDIATISPTTITVSGSDYVLLENLEISENDTVEINTDLSLSIAAASVVAKVTRDRIMVALDAVYPEYGFARHKGYGTRAHVEALLENGPTPVHRMSFRPVREAAERGNTSPRQEDLFE